MIVEVAEIHIPEGQSSDFEAAVKKGIEAFVQPTTGFIRYELRRSIETPTRYLLLIQWETLESHTVTFRESDNFTQWRGVVGPYFTQPPYVEHFELCE